LKRTTLLAYAFCGPALALLGVFFVYPVVMVFYLSFVNWQLNGQATFVGLSNYLAVLADPQFWNALTFTLKYTVVVVPAQVILGLLVALVLNQKIRGKSFFRVVYFIPVVTPWVVSSVIWMWIFASQNYGALNYILLSLGLINAPISWLGSSFMATVSVMILTVWKGIGWAMVIFLASLQVIPKNLYDAAAIDGTSRWRVFWRITFPLIIPLTMTVSVLLTIGAVNAFTQMYVLTGGGPMYSTESLNMYMYRHAFGYLQFSFASAATVITFLLILALSIVQIRFLGRRRASY
jgi:ABC-type sugar transport system permease subunit